MSFTIPFFHKDFPNKAGKVVTKKQTTKNNENQNHKAKKPHLQVDSSLAFQKMYTLSKKKYIILNKKTNQKITYANTLK